MTHFSRRVPSDLDPNRIQRALEAKRAAGARIFDLTQTNPTRVSLPAPPVAAWDALVAGASGGYDPAPLGSEAAREAVSIYYSDRGHAVPAERVVLTASTSEAYAHLFRLLADPEDEFLVPEPSYPLFGPLAELEAVRLRPYPLRYADGRWQMDLAAVAASVSPRTRALVVVHPNNPTGSFVSVEEAENLESLCVARRLALVSDEVFSDFAVEAAPSRPSLVDASRVMTFVLSGLSKVCGLPQVKLGWIVLAGPLPEVANARQRLEWIADSFLSVSSAAQTAAPALLAGRHAFQESTRARLKENLLALDARKIERLPVEGGWSVVIRAPSSRSEEDWVCDLIEAGVLVHPGHFYDFAEESYLVVSLLPEPETFREGLRRMGEVLAG